MLEYYKESCLNDLSIMSEILSPGLEAHLKPRVLHYFEIPQNEISRCEQTRIAEHTKTGSLALLM